jgi:YgiT-type zinc finger domain-containing protein
MRCERCDQAERVPVRRAKTTERAGHVAVVLGVPMEECPSCGERWLAWDVAARLDEILTAMLASDVEVATRHYEQPDDRTAA